MEALIRRTKGSTAREEGKAEAFIEAITYCRESRYQPVGLGMDHRYHNGAVCGSALVHEGSLIHAAFFGMDEDTQRSPRMASLRQRREHRHL